jgi:hypothetical protein
MSRIQNVKEVLNEFLFFKAAKRYNYLYCNVPINWINKQIPHEENFAVRLPPQTLRK